MSESSLRAEGKIRLARERLVGKYPLHAALLARMRVVERPTVATMAVTAAPASSTRAGEAAGDEGEVLLLYNAEFVLGIRLDELVGVLLHEVHHLLFNHLAADPKDFPDRWARTVAEEVTVNEFIAEPLPGDPVLLRDFPTLPPGESTAERYRRLRKVPRRARAEIATTDDHGAWGDAPGDQQAPGALKGAVAQAVEDAVVEAGGLPEDLPDELKEAVRSLAGSVAGDAAEAVRRGRRGTVDWRAVLRRHVGRVLEVRPVYNRPPRRFPEMLGILPGRGRQASRPKVLAVIDTSASITPALLTAIDGELARLARHHEVTVAECDVRVQAVYRYRPLQQAHGRGGTDLRPPLQPAFLRQHRPDVVVYLTDGHGPAPDRPPRTPVIWCLTPGGTPPVSWGRRVQMREHTHGGP
jgi:predicted metal-dependent peptidase